MLARTTSIFTPRRCSLQRSFFSITAAPKADFTHAVIGGGVVGLAIARQLSQRPSTSTVLLERHAAVGTETSSRNSEVIHAGIYYPPDSLKTRLCVRGKHLLYALCAKYAIPHRRLGKWIVAQTDAQMQGLEALRVRCRDVGVDDLRWVGAREVERDGGGVRADAGALESPSTGIVDSHALMECLRALLEDAGGVVALNSCVVGMRPGAGGWELDVETASVPPGEHTLNNISISADTVVNAAGLGAVGIHNLVVPEERRLEMFYAKGNYFSYAAKAPHISRLIYPATEAGAGGLGTHLTLDLAGRIRFGPDVEWVTGPDDLAVSASRLADAVDEIKKYLPGIDASALAPDYAGIRPKLAMRGGVAAGKGFQDFVIRREPGYDGWINLLGIESPGLTSSLAIAEMVEGLLYGHVNE